MTDETISTTEAAKIVGVKRKRMWEFAKENRLPSIAMIRGSRVEYRFKRKDVEAFAKIERKPGNLTGEPRC